MVSMTMENGGGYKDYNYDDINRSYVKEQNSSKSNSDDDINKVTSPHKMPVTNDKEDLYLDDFSFYSNDDYSHSNSKTFVSALVLLLLSGKLWWLSSNEICKCF